MATGGGRPRRGAAGTELRTDAPLGAALLGLIEDGYLRAGTLTRFAVEVLQIIACAATVPVAFTEAFLRAYLSIDHVVNGDDGRITIIPKDGAPLDEVIHDVDEMTAQVDPAAVFNPVVRAQLDSVHQVPRGAMRWDIDTLAGMDDDELMAVLREMQDESERAAAVPAETRDAVRARIETIRRNISRFRPPQGVDEAG